MKLKNNVLELNLTTKAGEMTSLFYKGANVLYDGTGEYWSGKNPTLFPIISSPNTKEYVLDGVTYPIKNHGLIRYAELDCIKEDANEVTMELKADENTLKQYPFIFNYQISYRLEGNKVIISYAIRNDDEKVMPFTFGIHPGFVCNFNEDRMVFDKDETAQVLTNPTTKDSIEMKLGEYQLTDFVEDIAKYHTVIFKPLKTTTYELVRKDYTVKIDAKEFKYLAMWTPNRNSGFMCIEPWCSIDDIKNTTNPFGDEFELHYLKSGETFNISYSIEVE